MKNRKFLKGAAVWAAAIVLTAAAMVYQNLTGPTHPLRAVVTDQTGTTHAVRLPRSHGGAGGCAVKLVIPEPSFSGTLVYRRYPTQEAWQRLPMERKSDTLTAVLPHQLPAGKLEYHVMLTSNGQTVRLPAEKQAIIRFRGAVPASIIIPHASLMFLAMLLANVTLLLALFGFNKFRTYAWITTAVLVAGGLILGPMVQKYAFGQYWTGFPNGFDLTDNKTLIAFIFWAFALALNLRKSRRFPVILAGIVMLVVFSIPHSARGSERDPDTGTINTGKQK
jgi:hypothetical protein